LNQDGIQLLEFFEGNKLEAYQDSGGVWTIGRGHTEGVSPGMVITQDQSDSFFLEDRQKTEGCVGSIVSKSINENQFAAAVCFAFNVKNWMGTPLFQFLAQGNFEAAKAHWLLYDHVTVNGQKIEVDGLKARREAELALFCEPVGES